MSPVEDVKAPSAGVSEQRCGEETLCGLRLSAHSSVSRSQTTGLSLSRAELPVTRLVSLTKALPDWSVVRLLASYPVSQRWIFCCTVVIANRTGL